EDNREAIKQQFSDSLQRLYSSDQPSRHTRRLWRSYRPMQGLDLNLGGFVSGLSARAVDDKPQQQQQQKQLLKGKKQEPRPKNKESETGHVMISYQHENKQLAMRIKDALSQHGFQGSDGGSTLSLMAEAVEGCFAFLMCMSRTYKDSNNCRLEAEYAYKKQKMIVPLLMEHRYRPSGWLGIMLGMGMYRDFSGKYPFEVKLAELLEVLRKAKNGEQPEAVVLEKPHRAVPAGEPSPSRPVSAGSREHHFPSAYPALPPINGQGGSVDGASRVRAWTREQTVGWLTERADLPESALAPSISGADLHFLVTARDRDARTFYRLAERYLAQPASVHSLARFVNALYEL
uniref:TIR domain-containing protein n=1 Tax=Macrostomum lignano TaxID=282301 RepID=A0A1I8IBC4_9PLAT